MKYLIMMTQPVSDGESAEQPYSAEDIKASWAHMQQIYRELSEAGELLATEKLAGPQAAKMVSSDGVHAPVVTDGTVPGDEGVPGRVLDGGRRERGAGDRDRRADVGGAGAGRRADGRPIEVRADHGAADPEW